MDPYEKQREKAIELLRKTKTDIAKRVVKSEERRGKERCQAAEMAFHEALEEYETGEWEWDDMVEDLSKTLKALSEYEEEED